MEISIGPWDDEPDPWWAKVLMRILPAANPDFEDQLDPLIRTWWIELDDDRIAQREKGSMRQARPSSFGMMDGITVWRLIVPVHGE